MAVSIQIRGLVSPGEGDNYLARRLDADRVERLPDGVNLARVEAELPGGAQHGGARVVKVRVGRQPEDGAVEESRPRGVVDALRTLVDHHEVGGMGEDRGVGMYMTAVIVIIM